MAQPLNREFVEKALPPRRKDAHKGSFGTLSIVAGSARYRGAALLCAEGALRSGVGIVRLCSTEPVCAAAAVRLPGCIALPLAQTPEGGIAATGAPLVAAEKSDAALLGCGLGNTRQTAQLVLALLPHIHSPLVLDADGLNVLAGHLGTGFDEDLRQTLFTALDARTQPTVLTPHIGEMARLCGCTAAEVSDNQEGIAARFARQHGCTVVLKSHTTVVAAPDGELYTCAMGGNSGLAKGGSGDVLAGIIAALLAQGIAAPTAAAAGVWLHAAAGKAAAEALGCTAMLPADLPHFLGAVFRELGR